MSGRELFVLFRRVNFAWPRDASSFNQHRQIRIFLSISLSLKVIYIIVVTQKISSWCELNKQRVREWSNDSLGVDVLRARGTVPIFFEAEEGTRFSRCWFQVL